MIVPVMAISNLVLTRQIYSAEPDGAHAHNRDLVPLSYLLLFNKHLEFDFFLTPSKIPTWTSQANSLKICRICVLPRRKT